MSTDNSSDAHATATDTNYFNHFNYENHFNYWDGDTELGERKDSRSPDELKRDFIYKEILPCIHVDQADMAIGTMDDLSINPHSHEIDDDIWELLNMPKPRFGHTTRRNYTCALFFQEDGNIWQIKFLGKYSGKRRYVCPRGIGDVPLSPPIAPHIVKRIAGHFNIDPPSKGESFWEWFIKHKEIPLIITEGAKKANALISEGFPAIALYGFACGVDKHTGNIKDSLLPFVKGRHQVGIAFDEDTKLETRRNGLFYRERLANALVKLGCDVRVWYWDPKWGKGIDDVIAANPGGIHPIYKHAVNIEDYKKIAQKKIKEIQDEQNRKQWEQHRSLSNPDIEFTAPYLNNIEMFHPGIGHAVKGGMSIGKTSKMVNDAQNLDGLLIPSYRNSLVLQTIEKINNHPGDAEMVMIKDASLQDVINNVFIGGCVDSLERLAMMIDQCGYSIEDYFSDKYIFIDEANSVIDHLLNSRTLSGKRIQIIEIFKLILKSCLGLTYADANLADWVVDIIEVWSGKPQVKTVNHHKNIDANLTFLDGAIEDEKLKKHDHYGFLLEMRDAIDSGNNIAVCADSQIFLESLEEYLKLYCGGVNSLRIDAKTNEDKDVQKFKRNPDNFLAESNVNLLLYNTSAESGLDISIKDYFTDHYGFDFGVIGCNSFAQLMGRIRDQDVNKHVWVRTFSIASNDDSISFSAEALAYYERQSLMLETNLLLADYAEQASYIQQLYQNTFQAETALALKLRAIKNYERANLRECALAVLTECGYNIQHKTIIRTDRIKAAKSGFKESKESVKEQNITDIATASDKYIGKSTARVNSDCNYADQCAIKKAHWCDRLPGLLNPDSMDRQLLRLVIYDAPKLIKGMELLTLVNNQDFNRILAIHKFNKALELGKVLPWLDRSSYLDARLLQIINVNSLIDALVSNGKLTQDHFIIQNIYSQFKDRISIDGQRARGSHWLRRSVPKCPLKLASILLNKVGIPHSVRDGVMSLDVKKWESIALYKAGITKSIQSRFESMINHVQSQDVPEKTVHPFDRTAQNAQPHIGKGFEPEKSHNDLYKESPKNLHDNVLPFEKQKTDDIKQFKVGDKISFVGWDGTKRYGVIQDLSDYSAFLATGEIIMLENLQLEPICKSS